MRRSLGQCRRGSPVHAKIADDHMRRQNSNGSAMAFYPLALLAMPLYRCCHAASIFPGGGEMSQGAEHRDRSEDGMFGRKGSRAGDRFYNDANGAHLGDLAWRPAAGGRGRSGGDGRGAGADRVRPSSLLGSLTIRTWIGPRASSLTARSTSRMSAGSRAAGLTEDEHRTHDRKAARRT